MENDITVIIATYNRSQDLKKTLEGICQSVKNNLSVNIIVSDNGSSDRTKYIVKSFRDRLSLKYIVEGKRGKNSAINSALGNSDLGRIIAFTDDDVDVSTDWLVSIQSVCNRWPEHSVFGGKINVVFPQKKIPKWVYHQDISSLAFGFHDYSNEESPYNGFDTPFGANFWIRREILDHGRLFDEEIGPKSQTRKMGSETSFLHSLVKDGYEIVYSPNVILGHRIQENSINKSFIYKRAFQWGLGKPHIYGLPQKKLLHNHIAAWRLYRYFAIVWNIVKLCLSSIFSFGNKRIVNSIPFIRDVGYHLECLKITKKS